MLFNYLYINGKNYTHYTQGDAVEIDKNLGVIVLIISEIAN